jgi:hypothetical protein
MVVGAVRMGVVCIAMAVRIMGVIRAFPVHMVMGVAVFVGVAVVRAVRMDVMVVMRMPVVVGVVRVVVVGAMFMGVRVVAMAVRVVRMVDAMRVDVVMGVPVRVGVAVPGAVGMHMFMLVTVFVGVLVMPVVAVIEAAVVVMMMVVIVPVTVMVVAVVMIVMAMTMAVIVAGRRHAGEVGAAFRIEGRGHRRHPGAEALQHILDHVVAAQAQPVRQDLDIEVPVAEMPGEAGKFRGVLRLHLGQGFGFGHDLDDAAVFQDDPVIHAQRDDVGEVEQDLAAPDRVQHGAALVAAIEVEDDGIDDGGLVIGAGGGDGTGAEHGGFPKRRIPAP